jgi:hypothetical protein
LSSYSLTATNYSNTRARKAECNFGLDEDKRATPIADNAAIKPMKRVGNHRRCKHILNRHDAAKHSVGIVLSVMRGSDPDPSHLGTRGTKFVHVAGSHHAIKRRDRRSAR